MHADTLPTTAPAPTGEPVPFAFMAIPPDLIRDDPELCVRFWRQAALVEGMEPVGAPEVHHYERALVTIGGKPTWVQDDGSPVCFVRGDVVTATRPS